MKPELIGENAPSDARVRDILDDLVEDRRPSKVTQKMIIDFYRKIEAGIKNSQRRNSMKINGMELNLAEIVGVIRIVTGEAGSYQASRFLARDLVIRATRRRYKGKILKRGPVEVLITIGRPNFAERGIIRRLGVPEGYVTKSVEK